MRELKYRSDSNANQNLKPLTHGFSKGVDHSPAGSAFTKTFPNLKVNPDQRLFPAQKK